MATTAESTQNGALSDTGKWRGLQSGHSQEWTVVANVKPGRGPALRKAWAEADPELGMKMFTDIGNLHDARLAMFDNDTRLLIATTFDGDWDAYINEWAADPRIVAHLDPTLNQCEGYPGLASPDLKDWFAEHGVVSGTFRSAYPDLTVQEIWKQQRVNGAFQALLDDPAFRTVLDTPALKPLRDLPTFQALLDSGAN